MATFTDVFERKEVKYHLDARQHRAMLGALAGHMAVDAYGRTRITSLYFDTPERLLIERSLDKPLYKEKLRLRCYGTPRAQDRVFVEIKKKYRGIVYKRRVGCSLSAAYAYLGGMPYEEACAQTPLADPFMAAESVAPRSVQITREIDQFILRYQPLCSSMLISCDRTAYAPSPALDDGVCTSETTAQAGGVKGDVPNDLRITFDAGISYRDVYAAPATGKTDDCLLRLLAPGDVVMEVKSSGPYPLWLVHALDACRAYPSSFSKYGEAYQACCTSVSRDTAALLSPCPAPIMPAMRSIPIVSKAYPRHHYAPRHAAQKGDRCA